MGQAEEPQANPQRSALIAWLPVAWHTCWAQWHDHRIRKLQDSHGGETGFDALGRATWTTPAAVEPAILHSLHRRVYHLQAVLRWGRTRCT